MQSDNSPSCNTNTSLTAPDINNIKHKSPSNTSFELDPNQSNYDIIESSNCINLDKVTSPTNHSSNTPETVDLSVHIEPDVALYDIETAVEKYRRGDIPHDLIVSRFNLSCLDSMTVINTDS